MNQTPTVTIPLSTAEKLTQIAQAMLALADDMKKHAKAQTTEPINWPIPDLTPPAKIPAEDGWFWSEEWQKGEREVNEDIKAGRVSRGFTSVNELMADLHAQV